MKILVKDENIQFERQVDQPINLLHLLQQNDAEISAPCGGNGSCGKCEVEISGVGKVLACQTVISNDWASEKGLDVNEPVTILLSNAGKAQISADGLLPDIILAPLINRGSATLDIAKLDDQRADEQRFYDKSNMKVPMYLLNQLSELIRTEVGELSFAFRKDTGEVTDFLHGKQSRLLGAAIDIGTTTMAAWLYDLETGNRLAAGAMYNPQRSFGADVISRIEKIDKNFENLKIMHKQSETAIAELVGKLLKDADLFGLNVCCLSISGNTTMMHILCGLNPSNLARSPFIPISLAGRAIRADEIGLELKENPLLILLPAISAYAGADVVAGIIACDLFPADGKKRLLVDLGTNGEIVLSLPSGLTACSAAAGPAFEAANMSCGMSGSSGAIDRVEIIDGKLKCSVIGDEPMRGICGSGLVSAAAALLKSGLIDDTGRFNDDGDCCQEALKAQFSERNGMTVFCLDRPSGDIYISQRDIRELQNAKAAVAAGVSRLLTQTGTAAEELDEVLLAGGFGYYLDVADAYAIGLLPHGAESCTKAVGNTSGMGAIACMLNEDLRIEAAKAAEAVKYFELSSDPVFTELYVDAMFFPELEG